MLSHNRDGSQSMLSKSIELAGGDLNKISKIINYKWLEDNLPYKKFIPLEEKYNCTERFKCIISMFPSYDDFEKLDFDKYFDLGIPRHLFKLYFFGEGANNLVNNLDFKRWRPPFNMRIGSAIRFGTYKSVPCKYFDKDCYPYNEKVTEKNVNNIYLVVSVI